GNMRAFVFHDVLKRWLTESGFKVKHVTNITDVDDKTIGRSREEGVPLKKVTERYTEAFFEDLRTLNILPADVYPRATETIPEMVALIKKLMDKKIAYRGKDGSVYYSIAKFPRYGRLSKIKADELKKGASGSVISDEYSREDARDFALWKAWDKDDGDVFWQTELGKGRPGWHIECSAMSMKNLGETFDIHVGGEDNKFPHHENEIAQSEGATGRPFVNYWLHIAFLMVDGKKMSKSLGNFYTLRDVLAKGYDSRAIRWLLFSAHYRDPLNFTFKALDAAGKTVDNLLDFMERLREVQAKGKHNEALSAAVKRVLEDWKEAMDNDLNVPEALKAMFLLETEANKALDKGELDNHNKKEVLEAMEGFDKVLGVLERKLIDVPDEVKVLAEEREKARKKKDFKKADELRKEISKKGWVVEDKPDGYRLRKE
ncbi:MAG: cysteine--tRNA ligase, partial [Candidatus Aenigmatarchaeota archaeon]